MTPERRTTARADSPAPRETMSFEEFLEATADRWAEWVDGEVILMSAVNAPHDDMVGFLYTLLRLHADHHGGRALKEPFVMKTGPGLPGRSPDVFFVAREHVDRVTRGCLRGPADVVIEVVSPESRKRDREEKLVEYERGGVREFWLIDPERREAEFHVLDEDGRYRRVALDAGGVFRSAVLEGARFRTEWLRGEPLPAVLSVAREWGLV
ncbi:MAG: Uma2 family endonuclease [Planctomycetota bacterium]|nr:Uma2 family endonuclease [Planctomycetota bacterium]